MACGDIVEDTREDITRFLSDSYIWKSKGDREEEEERGGGSLPYHSPTHNILRLLLDVLLMCVATA